MYKLSTNNEARYSHLRLNYKLSKLVQFTKTRKREREKERECWMDDEERERKEEKEREGKAEKDNNNWILEGVDGL